MADTTVKPVDNVTVYATKKLSEKGSGLNIAEGTPMVMHREQAKKQLAAGKVTETAPDKKA